MCCSCSCFSWVSALISSILADNQELFVCHTFPLPRSCKGALGVELPDLFRVGVVCEDVQNEAQARMRYVCMFTGTEERAPAGVGHHKRHCEAP